MQGQGRRRTQHASQTGERAKAHKVQVWHDTQVQHQEQEENQVQDADGQGGARRDDKENGGAASVPGRTTPSIDTHEGCHDRYTERL